MTDSNPNVRVEVFASGPVTDEFNRALDAWLSAGPETLAQAEADLMAAAGSQSRRMPGLNPAGARLILEGLSRRDARIDELVRQVARVEEVLDQHGCDCDLAHPADAPLDATKRCLWCAVEKALRGSS